MEGYSYIRSGTSCGGDPNRRLAVEIVSSCTLAGEAIIVGKGGECAWLNYTPPSYMAKNSESCVFLPEQTTDAPSEQCSCPPEPLEDRISRSSQPVGVLPSDTVTELTATCPDESTLLSGGCNVTIMPNKVEVYLASSGVSLDDPNTWHCVWNNTTTADLEATAYSVCAAPPSAEHSPEAEPIADRILHVQQTEQIPATGQRRLTATCDEGDYLIAGSCMLDSLQPPRDELTLFTSGFEIDNEIETNTWECGWTNTTGVAAAATTTAICLRPPSS